MDYERRIYNEDGINWAWFTELTVMGNSTVRIDKHYRLHKGDHWPEKNKTAPYSPMEQWREDDKRNALEYRLHDLGWCRIVNPRYIFDYTK